MARRWSVSWLRRATGRSPNCRPTRLWSRRPHDHQVQPRPRRRLDGQGVLADDTLTTGRRLPRCGAVARWRSEVSPGRSPTARQRHQAVPRSAGRRSGGWPVCRARPVSASTGGPNAQALLALPGSAHGPLASCVERVEPSRSRPMPDLPPWVEAKTCLHVRGQDLDAVVQGWRGAARLPPVAPRPRAAPRLGASGRRRAGPRQPPRIRVRAGTLGSQHDRAVLGLSASSGPRRHRGPCPWTRGGPACPWLPHRPWPRHRQDRRPRRR